MVKLHYTNLLCNITNGQVQTNLPQRTCCKQLYTENLPHSNVGSRASGSHSNMSSGASGLTISELAETFGTKHSGSF